MQTITRSYLLSITDQLAETVTDPRFLRRVEEIQRARDDGEQYALASEITAESLAREGVDLPAGFRVVPRTFENPDYARHNGIQPPGREPGSGRGEVEPASYDHSSWPVAPLPGQPSGAAPPPEEIARQIRASLCEIADFVAADPFRRLLSEMAALAPEDRPGFVLDVVLSPEEMRHRGIVPPDHLQIQRSTFHDERPTLFCVSALTPLAYPWRKVTVTFDNVLLDGPPGA